jgi:hypothetical protein
MIETDNLEHARTVRARLATNYPEKKFVVLNRGE